MRPWKLTCVECATAFPPLEVRYRCSCGGTLEVQHDSPSLPDDRELDRRLASRRDRDRSGVWRYRELILPLEEDEIVSRREGNTNVYRSEALEAYTGVGELFLKHEGENPSGSFKDRGMTVALSVARLVGARAVACASTGNTSASLASYAAACGLPAFVFVPAGKIAFGKLSQALAHGAHTLQVPGDFDGAMRTVQEICDAESIYLVNSINPFRIEGQKSIAFELLHELEWKVPDWIVVPGGNLGNSSALAKGLDELRALGRIDRLPRLAVVQAEGAAPLARAWRSGRPFEPIAEARTVATAIRIGAPVSWRKCLRGLAATRGVVVSVSDQEILDAKARVDGCGIGAEPASCATVAGIRRLREEGVLGPGERTCAILTGHLLKDPEATVRYHTADWEGFETPRANSPVPLGSSLAETRRHLQEILASPPPRP